MSSRHSLRPARTRSAAIRRGAVAVGLAGLTALASVAAADGAIAAPVRPGGLVAAAGSGPLVDNPDGSRTLTMRDGARLTFRGTSATTGQGVYVRGGVSTPVSMLVSGDQLWISSPLPNTSPLQYQTVTFRLGDLSVLQIVHVLHNAQGQVVFVRSYTPPQGGRVTETRTLNVNNKDVGRTSRVTAPVYGATFAPIRLTPTGVVAV